jgi:hypothetical protein
MSRVRDETTLLGTSLMHQLHFSLAASKLLIQSNLSPLSRFTEYGNCHFNPPEPARLLTTGVRPEKPLFRPATSPLCDELSVESK